jgi:tetratricopeptide (TPR) repeat protein
VSATLATPDAWLESFVPRLALRLASQLDERDWVAFPSRGVVMIADIVSFTPFAIERAGRGRKGQAELGSLLDRCVTLVAERTDELGGELVGFAGDSLISLFAGSADRDCWAAAMLCAKQILKMGAGLHSPGGPPGELDAPLPNISLGLAGGPVTLLVMRRGPRSYAVLLGDPVIAAARARASAPVGTIGVDAELGRAGTLTPGPLPQEQPSAGQAWRMVESFAPVPVLVRGREGRGEWLAEIRPVTSMFAAVRLGGEALRQPVDVVRAVEVVDDALAGQRTSIDRVLHDDKGLVISAMVGAHLDQTADRRPERAVSAGLAVADALASAGMIADVGIATGRAIVGGFGGPRGRVFAVTGPHVNLAARLMQSADGRVLVDGATAELCQDRSFSEPLALDLKGISEPVRAHVALRDRGLPPAVSQRADALRRRGREIVGRAAELNLITDELVAFDDGRGRAAALAVTGELGIGKTTVLDAIAAERTASGAATLTLQGDPMAPNSPFGALAPILDEQADGPMIGPTAALEELRAVEWSAGAALRPDAPDNSVLDAATAALHQRLGHNRVLLIVRDAHWVDEASLAALERVSAQTDRVLLLLEARSEALGPARPIGRFLERVSALRIELSPLDGEEVRRLVERWLGVTELPSSLVATLAERAAGNPFFLRQLVLNLPQLGQVVRRGDVAQLLARPSVESLADVPGTIHDALAGRIDRLEPDALLTLKAASALGLTFELPALLAVHPLGSSETGAREALDRLVEAEIIEAGDGGEQTFRFRHALYREVTYSLLTQPQRTAIHTSAAQWIEREGDPDRAIDLFAHHWAQAEVADRAVPLLAAAARRSASFWAGQGTIELLTSAKRLAERAGLSIGAVEHGEWDVLLGQAYRAAGEIERADELFLSALARLDIPMPRSRAGRMTSIVAEASRQLANRTTGARVGRRSDERERLAVAISVCRALFVAAYQKDDLLQMGLLNLRILNLVEAAGLRDELPVQYSMAQLAAATAGASWLARRYRRLAMQAAEDEHGATAAHSRTYDGVFLIGEGDFGTARDQLARAEEFYSKVVPGSYIEDVALTLRSYVAHFTGAFAESFECNRRVYESGAQRGDPSMVAWGLNGEAMSLVARGEDSRAIECLERTRELPMERLARIAWHSFYAVAGARLGTPEEARVQADAAIALLRGHWTSVAVLQVEYAALAETALLLRDRVAPSVSARDEELHRTVLRQFDRLRRRFPSAAPRYHLCEGDLGLYRGHVRRARRCYERATELSGRLGMPVEEALAHHGLAALRSDEAQAGAARERLRRLGVRSFTATLGEGHLCRCSLVPGGGR